MRAVSYGGGRVGQIMGFTVVTHVTFVSNLDPLYIRFKTNSGSYIAQLVIKLAKLMIVFDTFTIWILDHASTPGTILKPFLVRF